MQKARNELSQGVEIIDCGLHTNGHSSQWGKAMYSESPGEEGNMFCGCKMNNANISDCYSGIGRKKPRNVAFCSLFASNTLKYKDLLSGPKAQKGNKKQLEGTYA